LQIRSVSAYGAYYSTTLPAGGGFQSSPTSLPSDLGVGGSAEIRWATSGEHSTFSLTYTPSYTGRVRYSSVNALNHALSLNATSKVAPRWSLGFSLNGNLSTIEQFLFSPTAFSNAASVSASFNDLSGAMLAGRSTNTELASALSTATLVESPVSALLYGQRMFTSAMQTSVAYSHSPRLSVTFSGGATRSQRVADSSVVQNLSLLPTTTSGNASVAISYSLSPQTQIGGSVTSSRFSSSLYDGYTTASTASLGRTLGQHWFWQIHGGIGVMNPLRQISIPPTGRHPVAGGSLGFRTFSHTLLGSYDRTAGDSYGLGVSTTSSATATWRFSRPGSGWWLTGAFSWQRMEGTALTNTTGWRTTAGFGRALGAHLAWQTEYAYLNYSGSFSSAAYSGSQSAVRVSLVWTAQPALAR